MTLKSIQHTFRLRSPLRLTRVSHGALMRSPLARTFVPHLRPGYLEQLVDLPVISERWVLAAAIAVGGFWQTGRQFMRLRQPLWGYRSARDLVRSGPTPGRHTGPAG